MARERSELEQRRDDLTRTLPGLSENRAGIYRRNGDALALDRAGAKHQATVIIPFGRCAKAVRGFEWSVS